MSLDFRFSAIFTRIVAGWGLFGLLAVVFLPSAFFKIARPVGSRCWLKLA